MKKIQYIAPALCITKVGFENMIAASIQGVSGADGLSVGSSTEAAGVTSGNVKREDYDVWSEDWSK